MKLLFINILILFINAQATLNNSNEPFSYQQFYKNFYECLCNKNDWKSENSKTQKPSINNTLTNINHNDIDVFTELWI